MELNDFTHSDSDDDDDSEFDMHEEQSKIFTDSMSIKSQLERNFDDENISSPTRMKYNKRNRLFLDSRNKVMESEEDIYNMVHSKLQINLKYNFFELRDDQVKWISTFLLMSPSSVKAIVSELNSFNRACFYIYEIPNIITIISKIYLRFSLENDMMEMEYLIVLIKFTLDTIIELHYRSLLITERKIIENLINVSLDLLKLTHSHNLLNNEKSCCDFLQFRKVKTKK
jgi:hypothetical protein